MNNIKLEKVSRLQDYNLETTEFDFIGKGWLIKEGDKAIGGLYGYKEDDDTFYIEEMEIDDRYKNKGYGTQTVHAIKKQFEVSRITGIALRSAISFWDKFKADFHDTCETCSYERCVYHKNFVIPEDGYYDDGMCDDYNENHFVVQI